MPPPGRFAPQFEPASPRAPVGTILPFARDTQSAVNQPPNATAIVNALSRMRESAADQSALPGLAGPPAATLPARLRTRGPSPRLMALRQNGLTAMAEQGAALLRQVGQGALSADDAASAFTNALRASPFSGNATGQLQAGFIKGLGATQNTKQIFRPRIPARPSPVPVQSLADERASPAPGSERLPPHTNEVRVTSSTVTRTAAPAPSAVQTRATDLPDAIAEPAEMETTSVEDLVRRDLELVANTGVGLPGLSFEEVSEALGRKRASDWRRTRHVVSTLAWNLNGLESLPASRIERRVAALKPDPGDRGFELRQKLWQRGRALADNILRKREEDPAASVGSLSSVQAARTRFEREPTAENSVALSEALIDAQSAADVPEGRLSPVTVDAASQWAQVVLREAGRDRPAVIQTLAARLQQIHGIHADLALDAIARHWADDPDATAMSRFLAERMDDVLIRPRDLSNAQAGDNRTVRPRPAEIGLDGDGRPAGEPSLDPLFRGDREQAADIAEAQRTPVEVRDTEGNFIRGAPIGEALDLSGQIRDSDPIGSENRLILGFRDRRGVAQRTDPGKHVVLFDDVSSRWLVFNRMFEVDEFDRAGVFPFGANSRTGEFDLAVPGFVQASINAARLPRDVLDGRVDLNSNDGIARTLDLATLGQTGTFARQAGRVAARRATNRDPQLEQLQQRRHPTAAELGVPDGSQEPLRNPFARSTGKPDTLAANRARTLAKNRANSKLQEMANDTRLENSRFFEKSAAQVTMDVDVPGMGSVRIRMDHVGETRSGRMVMFESKASKTAPLTNNQKLAFPQIAISGAWIAGKKSEQLGNVKRVPPGRVRVLRPREK